MAIEDFAEFSPKIHPSAFIAASADVIGRVTLHENTSIWYQATLRGDINDIVIGPNSNIQDNAVVHLADDYVVLMENYGCHPFVDDIRMLHEGSQIPWEQVHFHVASFEGQHGAARAARSTEMPPADLPVNLDYS